MATRPPVGPSRGQVLRSAVTILLGLAALLSVAAYLQWGTPWGWVASGLIILWWLVA